MSGGWEFIILKHQGIYRSTLLSFFIFHNKSANDLFYSVNDLFAKARERSMICTDCSSNTERVIASSVLLLESPIVPPIRLVAIKARMPRPGSLGMLQF